MTTIRTESLANFYERQHIEQDDSIYTHHFNAFNIQERLCQHAAYPAFMRRDFYKIMLLQGNGVIHYGDESIAVSNYTLLFFNPRVPYTYKPQSSDIDGYFCVFKDDFYKEHLRMKLEEIPLFMPGAKPVFALGPAQLAEVAPLFKKILQELNSDYQFKYDLIRSYVSELIYYAMKLEPHKYTVHAAGATMRITSVFLELLDRQFPVELSREQILLRSPGDFAAELSIHVNYLNRAVKKETGKTTTEHIAERLIAEAKAMLKHTDLNIAEISYLLGFEDQAHFNNSFKKRVKMSPSAFRLV